MSDCIWDLEYWLNLEIYQHPPCMFTLWYLGLLANAIVPPIKEFIESLMGGGEDGDDKKEGEDGDDNKEGEDGGDEEGDKKDDEGGDDGEGGGDDGGEEEEEEQQEE